jgi:hypothetical protein
VAAPAGGAIPEAWPLAVSALIGLDDLLPRMPAFRDHPQEVMLAEHGTQLFSLTRTSPDPNRCVFEVSVGENAMEFTPEEVVRLLRELLDRATDRSQ